MRLELTLSLWALAIGATSVAGFSYWSPPTPSFAFADATTQEPPPHDTMAMALLDAAPSVQMDLKAPPIFSMPAPTEEPRAPSVPPSRHGDDPVLRGLIAVGGEARAIFAMPRNKGEYVTAGVGDRVGQYRILSITSDAAKLFDETTQVTKDLPLRGAGELSQ